MEVLGEALELWTGAALEGLTGPWPTSTREVLEAELLTVRLDHFDARLRLGAHADCVGPLGAPGRRARRPSAAHGAGRLRSQARGADPLRRAAPPAGR
ncbi:MAG: BTAD domain-containing putative transcriptional regulator [Umezawaea sp.]